MTGWRIGMALGNPDLIAAISKVKENTDSGVFNAIQYAGDRRLQRCADTIPHMLQIYARRRDLVVATLRQIGIEYTPARGTFYLWVPTPSGMSEPRVRRPAARKGAASSSPPDAATASTAKGSSASR